MNRPKIHFQSIHTGSTLRVSPEVQCPCTHEVNPYTRRPSGQCRRPYRTTGTYLTQSPSVSHDQSPGHSSTPSRSTSTHDFHSLLVLGLAALVFSFLARSEVETVSFESEDMGSSWSLALRLSRIVCTWNTDTARSDVFCRPTNTEPERKEGGGEGLSIEHYDLGGR